MHIHVLPRAAAQHISLALLPALCLEQLHHAVLEAQAAVGYGAFHVDADHAAKSPARRARPERTVETE